MQFHLLTLAGCYVTFCPHSKSIYQLIDRSARIFGVVFLSNFIICFVISCSASFKTLSHSSIIISEFSLPFLFPVRIFADIFRRKNFKTDFLQIIHNWDCSFIGFGQISCCGSRKYCPISWRRIKRSRKLRFLNRVENFWSVSGNKNSIN